MIIDLDFIVDIFNLSIVYFMKCVYSILPSYGEVCPWLRESVIMSTQRSDSLYNLLFISFYFNLLFMVLVMVTSSEIFSNQYEISELVQLRSLQITQVQTNLCQLYFIILFMDINYFNLHVTVNICCQGSFQ